MKTFGFLVLSHRLAASLNPYAEGPRKIDDKQIRRQ